MDGPYTVGFKDVYPWVWSVILGVALTLAERRGAFAAAGVEGKITFWKKNIAAVLINVVLPAIFFGLTMTRLGPLYSSDMDFWQILGTLYLAGLPLGTLHVWLFVALKSRWMPDDVLQSGERKAIAIARPANLLWATIAFGIPALAVIFRWRLPF